MITAAGCLIVSFSRAAYPAERSFASTSVKAYYLPAQPMSMALETFARISNHELLYDGGLARDRQSSYVDGAYTPEVALDILLAGSGLQAELKDDRFFAITPVEADAPGQSAQAAGSDRRYYATIQAAMRRALCDVWADHRIAARLWVGRSGEVLQAKTLAAQANGDHRIEGRLRGLRIGAPPSNFAQPITIVVEAGSSAPSRDCAAPLRRADGELR